MEKNCFITITGISHYYEQTPFEIGRIVKIVKEPENSHNSEAIYAELPFIGKVGYVADSANTVYRGTTSAGRIYDKIEGYAYAQVLFITPGGVISLVLSPEAVENDGEGPDHKEIIQIDDPLEIDEEL